jgi:predicted phage terminase large subunit-like protein
LKKVETDKDKITRAWKLTSIFEEGKVFFRKSQQDLLIEHMVLFPNHRYKDLFDAFDLAVRASRIKNKRKRAREPGVI